MTIALLALQGLFFVAWAGLMFRMLFGILDRFRAETGRRWIGPIEVFGVFGRYLRAPGHRGERRLILAALLGVVAVGVLRVLILTGG